MSLLTVCSVRRSNQKGMSNMTHKRFRRVRSTGIALAFVAFAAFSPARADEVAVPVPDQKAGETLADVLLPGGKRVGFAAISVRDMEGGEQAANKLFTRLTAGAKDVTPKDFPGKIFERPDGGTIAYLLPVAGGTPPTIVIKARDIPIRQLQFPPYPGKDGGGEG
jgi:hypothetical protein